MLARWLAVGVLGFTVGAATIVLIDPGATSTAATPVAATSVVDPHAGHAGAVVDNGQLVTGVKAHDIAAEHQPDVPLDAPTRAALADQLVEARQTALAMPTVADAVAHGFKLAGGFAPGSGAHYVTVTGAGLTGGTGIDVAHPNTYIYDGTSPTSKIVGLMYVGVSQQQPEGFDGPNDHWHRHANVCIKYTSAAIEVPLPADSDVTPEQCQAVGGNLMKQTVWMVHAWVVPGWESPEGVFSHNNSNVVCADGTINTDKVGFCQGT